MNRSLYYTTYTILYNYNRFYNYPTYYTIKYKLSINNYL